MPRRSITSIALVLVVLLAACTGSGEDASSTTPSTTAARPATTSEPTPTTTPAPTTSTIPIDTSGLAPGLADQVVELIGLTQDLRELPFLEAPAITVVSGDELIRRVQESVREDVEDVDVDQAMYVLLGLLPEGSDLLSLYSDLYGEQVAGYYDLEERELVIPSDETELTPYQRWTLVHELTHALTDQHFDVGPRFTNLVDDDDFDRASALQGLLEGDAVLVQLLFLSSMSQQDQKAILTDSLGTDSPVFDSAPPFVQESLVFPYQAGLTFVQDLYQQGGFDAIDRAYREPPLSTEQIITPEAYGSDAPVEVDLAALEIAGYEEAYGSVWGELGFRIMFDQVLGPRPDAVDGWGGDAYRLWFDGTDVVMVLSYRGDTETDAAELFSALQDYVPAAMAVSDPEPVDGAVVYSGDDYAYLGMTGDTVTFIAASDPQAGERVTDSYQGP